MAGLRKYGMTSSLTPAPLGNKNLCYVKYVTRLVSPQVKIWFQNRRMKWRNSKERELLSSGGCREQTLPTKANPHPDLSDVGKKSEDDEEDEDEAFGRQTTGSCGVSSPSLSSKHSDFSESDEEEITVS